MYTHIRGTTFQFIGQMQNDGVVQDLTGATLVAKVYDETGVTFYGNLAVTIENPSTAGLAALTYPNTLPWPVGKARMDMVLTLPNSQVVASKPIWFRIEQNPILG